MIKYVNGDITETELAIIAHGCNCQHKMGSGVALAIRNKFPEAYEEYMKRKLSLGSFIPAMSRGKLIGNLLTQEFYGHDGKVYANKDAIKIALDSFCYFIRGQNPFLIDNPAIAIPKIGCGLGGLKWDDVLPIIEELSEHHSIDFYVYDTNQENWK